MLLEAILVYYIFKSLHLLTVVYYLKMFDMQISSRNNKKLLLVTFRTDLKLFASQEFI